MKIKKIFTILVILGLMLIPNIAKSYTISADDVQAKKGEEFTVNINVDEETPLANGHIKYDASKVEFVKANQQYMNVDNKEEGNLAWIYVNVENLGVKNFEFVFKIKEEGSSEMKFEDLAFVDVNGNEYAENDISGNKIIQINPEKGKNSMLIILIVAITVIIIAIIAILFIKKQRKNRK